MDPPFPRTEIRLHPPLFRRRPFGEAILSKRPLRPGPAESRLRHLPKADSRGGFGESAQKVVRREKNCHPRIREPAAVQPGARSTLESAMRRRVAKLFSARALADDLAVQPVSAAPSRR